jgi:hypothetical protein
MLEFLHGKLGDRELRLFALACMHLNLHRIFWEHHRQAVAVMERFIDGQASAEDYQEMKALFPEPDQRELRFHPPHSGERACEALFLNDAWAAADSVISPVLLDALVEFHAQHKDDPGYDFARDGDNHRCAVLTMQASALRDIVGNPFHPPTIEEAWRTATVTSLAHAIYADHAFDRMPILGDALEDAGCTDADVLAHCRQPGPHVRGCWVVDLMLGKE